MTPLFAANWKMNHGPAEAERFALAFTSLTFPDAEREIWFFPPAVTIQSLADGFRDRPDIRVGAQDVHWEVDGAFTGALSIALAREVGASGALVGHSERRHLFGETEKQTGLKMRALVDAGLTPFLCVGETLEEREAGLTAEVVLRQLQAGLADLTPQELGGVVIAYEPVWAIGTGRNATPDDAAEVHAEVRRALEHRGAPESIRVLYGGSVKPSNALSLLGAEGVDGVLVGGASLDPESWAEIVGFGGSSAAPE